MIKSISLWHITPANLGIEFIDATNTTLEANSELYRMVNDPEYTIDRTRYNGTDYDTIQRIRHFINKVREKTVAHPDIRFDDNFPDVTDCLSKIIISDNLFCYVMASGIVIFYERGRTIPIEEEEYYSISAFHERVVYENDYCYNPEVTERKKEVYSFLELLWSCIPEKDYPFTSSKLYGNHGISYTLCITVIDIPKLESNNIGIVNKRNVRALLDTSAFNNILNPDQRELIKKRIDNDNINDLRMIEMSETLVIADNWSGVVVIGDIAANDLCLKWFLDFEIYLQASWFLFDVCCDHIVKQKLSIIEMQDILNRAEFAKVKLNNDIGSNMEQCQHVLRQSLIKTSDINTIYHRMHGLLTNKLKIEQMKNETDKSKYALIADISLFIVALIEVYGVIREVVSNGIERADFISIAIMTAVAAICTYFIIKGHK